MSSILYRVLLERNFIVHYVAFVHVPCQVSGLMAIPAHTLGYCLLGYVELLPVHVLLGVEILDTPTDSVAQTCLSAIWKNTLEFV